MAPRQEVEGAPPKHPGEVVPETTGAPHLHRTLWTPEKTGTPSTVLDHVQARHPTSLAQEADALHAAVHALGHTFAQALKLEQIMTWLTRKLTPKGVGRLNR